jgi:hypothetical protein
MTEAPVAGTLRTLYGALAPVAVAAADGQDVEVCRHRRESRLRDRPLLMTAGNPIYQY